MILALSVALFAALVAAGVGWYRYFVLAGFIKAIDGVLGQSIKKLQEIDAKAKSHSVDAV